MPYVMVHLNPVLHNIAKSSNAGSVEKLDTQNGIVLRNLKRNNLLRMMRKSQMVVQLKVKAAIAAEVKAAGAVGRIHMLGRGQAEIAGVQW
jgi:hypothetical protein